MKSVIHQSVLFPVAADVLFEQYTDPERHAAITGAPVEIDATPGAPFRAFDGVLEGTILTVIKPILVVQTWRSTAFHEEDPDSTLVLCFRPESGNGRIDLVHLDVPDHDFEGVTEGWEKHYWSPWRDYLASRRQP